MFNKKYKVRLITPDWVNLAIPYVKLDVIPNQGQLIYLNDLSSYYRVIQVIHQLGNTQEFVLVLEDFTSFEKIV